MGNHCNLLEKHSNVVEAHIDRILYKTVDNNPHNIAELTHEVVDSKAKCFSTMDEGDTKKCHPPLMPMTQFIKICSRNRPVGISDISWDRFLSSICLECPWIDVLGEVEQRERMEATPDTMGKKDLMVEVSGRSTPTASDSSVEYAGKFIFAEVDTDNSDVDSDTISKSPSSLSAQSLPTYFPDRSFAKYYSDLSSDEKVSSGYDKKLGLKYALSLGDIQCNSFVGKSSHEENLISSKATSTITDLVSG